MAWDGSSALLMRRQDPGLCWNARSFTAATPPGPSAAQELWGACAVHMAVGLCSNGHVT